MSIFILSLFSCYLLLCPVDVLLFIILLCHCYLIVYYFLLLLFTCCLLNSSCRCFLVSRVKCVRTLPMSNERRENKQAKIQSFHLLICSLTIYSFILSMFSYLLFCSMAVLLLYIILYCRSSLASRVNNFRTLSSSNERGGRKNTRSSCPVVHSCHPSCCAFCSVAVLLSLEYIVSKPSPRVTKKGKEKTQQTPTRVKCLNPFHEERKRGRENKVSSRFFLNSCQSLCRTFNAFLE